MADIRPFCAIRYNEAKLGASLASVVAPPYDVISLEEQDILYSRNPYNCVRLVFNHEYDGDGPSDNRYTRAAKRFDEWQRKGVLTEDLRPAYYIYEQTFQAPGGLGLSERTRRGVLVALKLEPFGTECVFPHKETNPSQKKDRLHLMQACRANLSPILGLVSDREEDLLRILAEAIVERAPVIDMVVEKGSRNRLWLMDDEAFCSRLTASFKGRNIVIADGHHRYEAACAYREERWKRDSNPGIKRVREYDYVLMMCVPTCDPGLHVLPHHRLMKKVPGFSKAVFLNKAGEFFQIKVATEEELLRVAESHEGQVRIGLILADRDRRILTAKPAVAVAMKETALGKNEAWRALDVSILHELLIKGILGVGLGKGSGRSGISLTNDPLEVLNTLPGSAAYDLGFILQPTRIDQICAVSEADERVPHKSTCFYPKLLSGLVMRKV